MDNETEVIRRQMEETRSALQEKLETLEQQVKETVQETTEAVTGTVEAVKATVETVKGTVQDTVETVKDTVEETVQTVKETLDLQRMVNAHPWPMFAGAAAVGFVGGRLLSSLPAGRAPAAPGTKSPSANFGGIHAGASALQTPAPPRRSWWSFLTDHYSEELDKLKGLAIATVGNVVREMVTENVPPQMATQTREVIDGIVTKLGARPIDEPIFHLGNRHEEHKRDTGASYGKPQEAGRF